MLKIANKNTINNIQNKNNIPFTKSTNLASLSTLFKNRAAKSVNLEVV